MKRSKTLTRAVLWVLLVGFVWTSRAEAQQGPYVILADGRRIEGTAIRARANGDVILSSDRGELTFTRGQYQEAWAARPAEIDQARQHLQARRYDQVISALEELVPRMRHLSWDLEALIMIGAAQVGKEDYQAALTTYDRLFQAAPERRDTAAVRWTYYRALLGAGQLDRLEGMLNELIAGGERADAARAQIIRGDIKRKRGLPADAVLDYLRTVVLFKAVTEAQPEALFKAGETLRELRHDKARETLRRVVDEHPDSPYAERARALL